MFQKGMQVRCVNNMKDDVRGVKFDHLTVGNVYTIHRVDPIRDGRIMLWIKKDNGASGNFLSTRFVPAKELGVFKEGDKVVVNLPNFDDHDNHLQQILVPGTDRRVDNPGLVIGLYEHQGKEFEILAVGGENKDHLHLRGEGDYTWSAAWLLHAQVPNEGAVKFEVGDYVYVKDKGLDGVFPRWLPAQDKAIGKKRKVKRVEKNHYVLSDNYAYQASSLVKWDEKKHGKPKVPSLRAIIAKARKEAKPRGLCSFTLIIEGRQQHEIKQFMGAPCHASIGYSNGAPAHLIDWVGYHENAQNKTRYKKWVDMIVHNSPWSPAYIQKETKNVLKNGADMNIGVHANVIASACIAMRMGSEYPAMLESFEFWLSKKFAPKLAFLMAYTFGQPNKKGEFTLQGMGGGHSVLTGELKASALLSLFKNGYNKDMLEPEVSYRNRQGYQVHETINRTAIDPLFKGIVAGVSWKAYVKNMIPQNAIGKGWDATYYSKADDVFAFANKLQEQLV